VPSEQPAALAAALDSLVADPERALAMGRTARARVLADFSTHTHLTRLGEAYDEATRHRASGSGPASGARRLLATVGR
jgi:glycosyltransferase involved in cell wall biosynthesis